MSKIFRIAGRELSSYFSSPMGWVIAAVVLLIDGLLFNGWALGAGQKLSSEVLRKFFYFSSGTTMIMSVLLAMRLLAEERQSGTLVLLRTAPVSSWQIVLGKYLSALTFLMLVTAATIYMPLLIMVNGKISLGHMAAGYLGLALLGSASISIGLFGSTVARNQVVAVVLGAAILTVLLVMWLLTRVTDPPLTGIVNGLALHHRHFEPFTEGVIHTRDLIYYASITYFFLLASVRTLDSQRWD